MKILDKNGEVEATFFTFPDGQRHVTLSREAETRVEIITRICNETDLFDLLLVRDVLGERRVDLTIRYLLGARMDRQIDSLQPFTLRVVLGVLSNAMFDFITVLHPHSNVVEGFAEATYPYDAMKEALAGHDVVVAPDAGSTEWIYNVLDSLEYSGAIVVGEKHRDSQTGKLSGFGLVSSPELVKDQDVLIMDDICDGGGTFTGLAKVLLDAGANNVDLYVTHGIFSKGHPLEGIRNIYTTTSYQGFPGDNTLGLAAVGDIQDSTSFTVFTDGYD